MKYYFKSNYMPPCAYSPNWFGTLDNSPMAQILLYNDILYFCIGYTENEADYNIITSYETITAYESEEQALEDIEARSIDNVDVWFGERLLHRWDVKVLEEGVTDGK